MRSKAKPAEFAGAPEPNGITVGGRGGCTLKSKSPLFLSQILVGVIAAVLGGACGGPRGSSRGVGIPDGMISVRVGEPGYGCNITGVMRVETDPTGAAVSVNEEYLGNAPLDIGVVRGCWIPGDPAHGMMPFTVRAIPRGASPEEELWPQASKIDSRQSIPGSVFFNLRLRPPPDQIIEHRSPR